MARIVVVHGIAQQFKGPHTLHAQLVPALRDGMELAGHKPVPEADVAFAHYGSVFREPGMRDADDVPPWDEYDVEPGLEADLLMAWWQEAARLDPAVPPPDDTGEGSRGTVGYALSRPLSSARVREALDALSGSRFFGRISQRLLIGELKQVRRYLGEPEVRAHAQAVVAAAVTDDTRVVVGHSLGSVVAYEALCANPDWAVRALVTLGSPLGIRGLIFDRLTPAPVAGLGAWPGPATAWTNVADTSDVVALVRELSSRFGPRVHDVTVSNGTEMHDLARYLTAAQTGAAIAAGLTA